MKQCPTAGELEGFLDERLVGERQSDVSAHVGACAECQSALERLTTPAASAVLSSQSTPSSNSRPAFLQQLKQRPPSSRRSTIIGAEAPSARPSAPPPEVPGYEILGELGRGGMGIVYKARQLTLDRIVALKVLRAGAGADVRERERFRQEAEAVARLRHPHIVHIYDISDVGGVPYFAMEYIEGGSLAARLRGDPLPVVPAARLAETLARTVHHAHLGGIVHRDLKPANILLSGMGNGKQEQTTSSFPIPQSPFPSPKVTDFGLAKNIDDPGTRTRSGEIVGTPCYMAPEQAAAGAAVGPHTDVYALGAILYELLTGRPPFKGATAVDTVVQLLHQEPVRPGSLRPDLPRDLETICLNCLRKEPGKRYGSALALAEDLRRFRRGKPISARPVGRLERAVKWARQHPLPAGLLAGMLLVATLGFAGVTWQWRKAESAHASVLEEKRQKELEKQQAEAARAEAADQRRQAQTALYYSRISQSQLSWRVNDYPAAQRALQACRPGEGQEDRRGWEWHYLHGLYRSELHSFSHPQPGEGGAVAYSVRPGAGKERPFVLGSVIAGSPAQENPHGELRVWDAATGLLVFAKQVPSAMHRLAFSPDGKRVALGGNDGSLVVHDAASGEVLLRLRPHGDSVASLAFSPSGKRIATGSWDGTLKLLDAQTGATLASLEGHIDKVQALAISPDGTRLASASWDRSIRIWDADSGKLLDTFRSHRAAVYGLAFSPEGKQLASAGKNGIIKLWEVATGRVVQSLTGLAGAVLHLAYSPDGRYLTYGGGDATVRVWAIAPAEERIVFRGHAAPVECVDFSPDGQRLVSCSPRDGAVIVWDLTRHAETGVFARTGADVEAVSFGKDGQQILSLNNQGLLQRWERATGVLLEERTLPVQTKPLSPAVVAAFSPGTRTLAARCKDDPGRVRVWDSADGSQLAALPPHPHGVGCVCFDPEGRYLATAHSDEGEAAHEIRVHDAASGELRASVRGKGRLMNLAFRPGTDWLCWSCRDGSVKLVHWPSGREGPALPSHRGNVLALAFSADGTLLATAGAEDRVVRLMRLGDGGPKVLHELAGPHLLCELAFSPDGKRLAGVSRDLVTMWDTEAGMPTLTLRGASQRHYDAPFNPRLAFSPDGARLAATNWNESLSLWEADPADDVDSAEARRKRRESADARAVFWHLQEAERCQRLKMRAALRFHIKWLGDGPLPEALRARRERLAEK